MSIDRTVSLDNESNSLWLCINSPFNNMQTLKFKAQPTNEFYPTVNQMFGGFSQLPTMLFELCSKIRFNYRVLGSGRKLGEARRTFD